MGTKNKQIVPTWPAGFRPTEDRVTLERRITVSAKTVVIATVIVKDGQSTPAVNVIAADDPDGPQLIPVPDMSAAMAAVAYLVEWVGAEGARLAATQDKPVTAGGTP